MRQSIAMEEQPMLRSIDLSRAGMLRQQQALAATAHNVANTSTPGFKATRAALESGDVPPDAVAPATGTDTPPLTARLAVGRLFTQGPIQDTGTATDMAIDGDGFFIVRQADGTEGYTRNGAFRIDAEGRLSDGAGRRVQPEVTLPPTAADLRVNADGAVTVRMPDGSRQEVGRLQLARFANPNGLLAGGDGVYTPTAASGQAQIVAPGQDGAGTIRGGALEGANTDITEQLTNLIAAQRAYQLNTSAFRTSDDMLRMAAQLQGNG
jgi:flagellar basal-body rod protein FlgG